MGAAVSGGLPVSRPLNSSESCDGVESVEEPGAFSEEVRWPVEVPGSGLFSFIHPFFIFLSQILMTVRATPVKMVALASMASTPTSVSVVMAGRGPTVRPVSLWPSGDRGVGGLGESQHGSPFYSWKSLQVKP